MDDPFVSRAEAQPQRQIHRYSSFDSQLFTLSSSSPAQVRRALEAHLTETERRLQDASKLGTALVSQQRELSDKLKELTDAPGDNDISPELRKRLVELEKEYSELGRESARAALGPKSRLISSDDGSQGTPSRDGPVCTLL